MSNLAFVTTEPPKAYFPVVHSKLRCSESDSLQKLLQTKDLPVDYAEFVRSLNANVRDPNEAIYNKAWGERIDSEVAREVAYQIGDYLMQHREIIYHKVWDASGARRRQPYCICYNRVTRCNEWKLLHTDIMWQKFEMNDSIRGLFNFLLRNFARIMEDKKPAKPPRFGKLLYWCYCAYKHGKFKNKSLHSVSLILCNALMYYYATILQSDEDIRLFNEHIKSPYWSNAISRTCNFVYFPLVDARTKVKRPDGTWKTIRSPASAKVDIGNCVFERVELKLPNEFEAEAIKLLKFDRRGVL